MGFREALFLGFVFFFSGENLCSATHNWSNFSTNEALNQIPAEQVTTSSQLPPRSEQTADHQSNQMERGDLVGSPVSYRLKSYQLRSPAVRAHKQKPLQPVVEQMQSLQNLQRSEAGMLTSEQLEQREAVQAEEMLNMSLPGQPLQQETKVRLKFEQRVPVSADSVSVRCGEGKVVIEVKQNFLGNGQLIHPSDLTLGGCPAVDTTDHILQFQTKLQGCGSKVKMTEEALIYMFTLMYSPTPISNTFILKTNPAEVGIQCHYQRRQHVSSGGMTPTWNPFSSNMQTRQQLHFSLRLMTEDWRSQRLSSVYFLSDVMHIEASVLQGHHVPLRVYVDSCVATATTNPNSQPRYSFISNYGCLNDAKLTGAKSYFMQRSQEDKLHFQLKAFRFQRHDRNSASTARLYITCHLKATMVSIPIDPQHKACSYLTEAKRWVASGGDNKVCSCCETSCREQRQKRSLVPDAAPQWEGTAALGPILLEDSILQEELTELSELLPEIVSVLQTCEVTKAASYSLLALLCGVGAVLGVALSVFMGAVICSTPHKPTGYSVCT